MNEIKEAELSHDEISSGASSIVSRRSKPSDVDAIELVRNMQLLKLDSFPEPEPMKMLNGTGSDEEVNGS